MCMSFRSSLVGLEISKTSFFEENLTNALPPSVVVVVVVVAVVVDSSFCSLAFLLLCTSCSHVHTTSSQEEDLFRWLATAIVVA